jgi:trimethylamine--corrinoid protein Co-methyltransferase
LETIAEVGAGGSYMMSEHTLNHMRTEFFNGNGVSDRSIRNIWEQEGSRDARQRAREIAQSLIEGNRAAYIAYEADTALRRRFHIFLPEDP